MTVWLRAASTLVAERGFSALTLNAVGAATGVSKGGVLYHFPTKEALVAALVEELAAGVDADQSAAHDADSVGPGAWTRAYLTASAAPTDGESEQLAVVGLLGAIGYDPSLLDPIRTATDTGSSAWMTTGFRGACSRGAVGRGRAVGRGPVRPCTTTRGAAGAYPSRLGQLAGANRGPRA